MSYCMKLEADITHYSRLWDYFIKLNPKIRILEASLEKENVNGFLQYGGTDGVRPLTTLENINLCLAKFAFDMYPYLESISKIFRQKQKVDIHQKCGYCDAKPDAVIQWAIDSATRQASQYITEGKTKLLAISGCYTEKAAKALQEMTCLRSKFDVILSVSIPLHHSIEQVKMEIFEQLHEFMGIDKVLLPLDEALKSCNFLLLLDCSNGGIINVYDLKVPLEHGCIVITTQLDEIYEVITVDLEIKMEYHMLPWELFISNLGSSSCFSSTFEMMALCLVEKCDGHLLAIIQLARALKGVAYIGSWELVLHELMIEHSSLTLEDEDMNKVMVCVLKFIWQRIGTVKKMCIKHCTSYEKGQNINQDSLISGWLMDGLIHTKEEGEAILEDLFDFFVLENFEGNVLMREETKVVLLKQVIPMMDSQLRETVMLEYLNVKAIIIRHNEVFELPESPKCLYTMLLSLQKNHDLMMIPPLFFQYMTSLHVLDLSYTSLKTLPASISRLISLQKLFLRGCELFMELPAEIGNLSKLQLLDLEGTEIMYLPKEVGQCRNLRQLKVSFYAFGNSYRIRKQITKMIPKGVLSNFIDLEELSVDVNPDDKQWVVDVVDVLDDIKKLIQLRSLKLYVPKVELLFQGLLSNFRFTVGHHEQRLISRIPHEVEEEFKKQDRFLKFVNGECVPMEIKNVLHNANAFLLDRHWTLKKLSEFKNENMNKLKFCLLVECNELETIVAGCFGREIVFGSLEYLGVYYMKSLKCISQGLMGNGSFFQLKYLTLSTCTNLTSMFKIELLCNLMNLEELSVKDCPKIKSLVNEEPPLLESSYFLPSLKKMSLLELPELINISSGLYIAPKLERLVIFYCPKLESLSTKEVSSKDLKVIKGESEWWNSLTWHESGWSSNHQDYLASIFVPLVRKSNLMTQLAED
ncbi:hypothetical protein NMG60_11029779 [Bertholletia excelsa]